MLRLLILAAMLMAPYLGSAQAPAAQPATIEGVWEGTIGNLPIRACFNEPNGQDRFGSYYYKSHLQLIYLRQLEGDPSAYVEGHPWEKNIPQWTIDTARQDELSGRWANGAKSILFRLGRVPGLKLKEDETPCSSSLFHQPRLQGLRVATAPAIKDGVRYNRLVLEYPDHKSADVETFELSGGTPAVRRINWHLRVPFRGDPPEWHDCELTAGGGNSNGGWDESYEPMMFTRRWLSVRRHVEAYCGGPHPDSWNTTTTFDLQTGSEVDLSKWLSKAAGQAAFRRMLLDAQGRGEDPDCAEIVEQSIDGFALDIELRRNGLAFTPNDLPHAVQACGDEAFISFSKLQRYLTPVGKKNVAALQAEVAGKR